VGHRPFAFFALLLGVPWVLSACGPATIKDTATHSYIPIQGWMLELNRDVTIPPGRTRVFFQNGTLTRGVDDFEPHCQLRVRDLSNQPQTVHADRFTIGKVFGTSGSIVSSGHILLAAAGDVLIGAGDGDGGDDGEGRLTYFYVMPLHSDKQPNVTYFVCGGAMVQPELADYPTLQDIRSSTGDYVTLVLP
jgi:hypothetical protein